MDETIRKYVERALAAAERRDAALDEDDLAEIARELGLTDQDLARVAKAVDDHIERGRGYAGHQMWDDAIRELEDASALAPSRLALRIELGEALAGRWAATDYPDDHRRATQLARDVLDIEPAHEPAFRLLARLKPSSQQPADEPSPGAAPSGLVIAVSLALVVVAGGAVIAFSTLADITPQAGPAPIPPPPESSVEKVEKFESSEVDLPLTFAGGPGIDVVARRSRLARYPDRAFYTLWGDIEVTGEVELQQLDLRVKLLDSQGAVIQTHSREAWGKHEADLRSGDHGVFTMLLDADPRAASVQLETGLLETIPATGPYEEPPLLEPKWAITAPEHLKLELRERHAAFSTGMLKDKGFFKATWEFRNVGDVPIRALTYEVNLYDDKDSQIESNRRLATFSSHPPMEAGDVFLESTIVMTDASYARYELVVTEIE